MFVRDRMSSPAITVNPTTTFQDALRLMHEYHFRRLPVVDQGGRLVGILSERDLLHAAPSPATSLSIWEMNYLLWKLTAEQLMTKRVVTVCADTPLEEAARLMVVNKIGGMPVLDAKGNLVGVITETDIFKAFVTLLGADRTGTRVVVRAPTGKTVFADMMEAILDMDGEITSVSTYSSGENDTRVVLKVRGIESEQLTAALEALGDQVEDLREV
jgi:acetoin utilization protein AcuB